MNRSTATTAALTSLAAISSMALLAVPASAAEHAPRPLADRAAAYAVSASVDKAVVVVGEDTVRIRGRVTPRRAARGTKVILQQRREGKKGWSRSGAAKVKRNGKFVIKDKPTAPGTRYYRVVKKRANGVKAGRSAQIKVDVYRWESLVERVNGPIVNVARSWDLRVANESRVGLVTQEAGTAGSVEFTLGRKCTSLRSTYALSDSSATGGTGSVTLVADGVTKVGEPLAIGTVEDRTTDITGAFRIAFGFTSTAAPAAYPAVVDAEVLCRG